MDSGKSVSDTDCKRSKICTVCGIPESIRNCTLICQLADFLWIYFRDGRFLEPRTSVRGSKECATLKFAPYPAWGGRI